MKPDIWYINLCIRILEYNALLGFKHPYVKYLINLKEKYDGK